ncbi:MAG: hypothetical protein HQK53_20310, partial [Oligoflexia bacterium]|nr:hypothetical protein [Oligoflexia bacterium]
MKKFFSEQAAFLLMATVVVIVVSLFVDGTSLFAGGRESAVSDCPTGTTISDPIGSSGKDFKQIFSATQKSSQEPQVSTEEITCPIYDQVEHCMDYIRGLGFEITGEIENLLKKNLKSVCLKIEKTKQNLADENNKSWTPTFFRRASLPKEIILDENSSIKIFFNSERDIKILVSGIDGTEGGDLLFDYSLSSENGSAISRCDQIVKRGHTMLGASLAKDPKKLEKLILNMQLGVSAQSKVELQKISGNNFWVNYPIGISTFKSASTVYSASNGMNKIQISSKNACTLARELAAIHDAERVFSSGIGSKTLLQQAQQEAQAADKYSLHLRVDSSTEDYPKSKKASLQLADWKTLAYTLATQDEENYRLFADSMAKKLSENDSENVWRERVINNLCSPYRVKIGAEADAESRVFCKEPTPYKVTLYKFAGTGFECKVVWVDTLSHGEEGLQIIKRESKVPLVFEKGNNLYFWGEDSYQNKREIDLGDAAQLRKDGIYNGKKIGNAKWENALEYSMDDGFCALIKRKGGTIDKYRSSSGSSSIPSDISGLEGLDFLQDHILGTEVGHAALGISNSQGNMLSYISWPSRNSYYDDLYQYNINNPDRDERIPPQISFCVSEERYLEYAKKMRATELWADSEDRYADTSFEDAKKTMNAMI